ILKGCRARLTLFRLRHLIDGSVSSANAEIRPDDCTDDAEGCRREGDNVLAPASAVWQLTQCERHYPEQGGEAESCNDYASHGVVPGFVPTIRPRAALVVVPTARFRFGGRVSIRGLNGGGGRLSLLFLAGRHVPTSSSLTPNSVHPSFSQPLIATETIAASVPVSSVGGRSRSVQVNGLG